MYACLQASGSVLELQRAVVQHETDTWKLVHVLLSNIDSEASGNDADTVIAFKRRARLSHWLKVSASNAACNGSAGTQLTLPGIANVHARE